MRKNIQPMPGLVGTAVAFEVSDHRVVSGIPAVPAVPAVPPSEENPSGSPEVPAVAAIVGNVDSQVAFYDAAGQQLTAKRARLNSSQYSGWSSGIIDDDAYFFACHASTYGVTAID